MWSNILLLREEIGSKEYKKTLDDGWRRYKEQKELS